MTEFSRPRDGFKFAFAGWKTNALANSLAPDKYALAVNVRANEDDSLRTRPGYTQLFTAGDLYTDMRAYVALQTDNIPRILVRDTLDRIYLDNGALVGTLAGGGVGPGAAMIPFRPNQSPNPYMYIANGSDYQKFSAPTAANAVVQQKVGIAEPQTPPGAVVVSQLQSFFWEPAGGGPWTNAGTAGTVSSGFQRVSDTIGGVFPDPVNATRTTLEIGSAYTSVAITYQRWMAVVIGGEVFQVQDVLPGIPQDIAISGIYYYSGTTGKCVVVPQNVTPGPGNEGASLYAQNLLVNLRRGTLVAIGTEVCLVLDVVVGPNGTICFETTTTLAHTTSDLLSGVPAIVVLGSGFTVGQTITSLELSFQVTAGIGTVTASQSPSLFVSAQASFQSADYLHFSVNIDDLANLTELKILFDVGDGSFTENFYYYTVRPADILAATGNVLTQLAAAQIVSQRAVIDEEVAAAANGQGITFSSAQTSPGSSQWSEIVIPISALTRVGNDQSRSLQNLNAVQMLFNASGTINVQVNSLSVTGGYQPDVGDAGQPYLYRVRPRSSVTGVVGNPSPATRYGVNARRQLVAVYPPSAAYDSQIDTWDVFRFGGSVTSWRWIGQIPASSGLPFEDNYSDDAAVAGDALDFDNFEPWPSIWLPLTGATTEVNGITAVVNLSSNPAAAAVITRFLPGTLVELGGQNVYTLWARPTSLGSNLYLLQFVENAGASGATSFIIEEPILANQMQPYMWGPDASGTVFGVGDALRPGTISYAKNYAPDCVPDSYNIEISPPSEPLLGGTVLDGLSFVASTERWWALYPQPDNPTQRYNPVQQPFTRGLAAPYGICTDGQSIYWWAKDGIYSSTRGSLTDADLYNLFPHDGVQARDYTYNGFTIKAPWYPGIKQFRLAYANGYLYATYIDSSGAYHQLVLDLKRMAWSADQYNVQVSCIYHVEQQIASGALTSPTLNPSLLLAGAVSPSSLAGAMYVQTDLVNDNGTPIIGNLAAFEFDGGDLRAPKQWGDLFVDSLPAAAGTAPRVTLLSQGAPVGGPFSIAQSTSRTRVPVSVGGIVVSDFMGLFVNWEDDFTKQSAPTHLYAWQPSFAVQPARMIGFETLGTDFDLNGYMHIRQIAVAWVSTAPVTLTLRTVDGQAPPAIVIPSSAGGYTKQMFPVGPNKGQLYSFQATSSAPFQLFFDDCEFWVGAWGRGDAYSIKPGMGGRVADQSAV